MSKSNRDTATTFFSALTAIYVGCGGAWLATSSLLGTAPENGLIVARNFALAGSIGMLVGSVLSLLMAAILLRSAGLSVKEICRFDTEVSESV